jgi:hypothetical protein
MCFLRRIGAHSVASPGYWVRSRVARRSSVGGPPVSSESSRLDQRACLSSRAGALAIDARALAFGREQARRACYPRKRGPHGHRGEMLAARAKQEPAGGSKCRAGGGVAAEVDRRGSALSGVPRFHMRSIVLSVVASRASHSRQFVARSSTGRCGRADRAASVPDSVESQRQGLARRDPAQTIPRKRSWETRVRGA